MDIINLTWQTSVTDTRNKVESSNRKKGCIIQYDKERKEGSIVYKNTLIEEYIGNDSTQGSEISNDEWSKDTNWKRLSSIEDLKQYVTSGLLSATPSLINYQGPLDARSIVTTKSSLKYFDTTFRCFGYNLNGVISGNTPIWYEGMLVTCLEDNNVYILQRKVDDKGVPLEGETSDAFEFKLVLDKVPIAEDPEELEVVPESPYATKAELNLKQDKLIAGDNISIVDNTIKAEGYKFDKTNNSFAIEGNVASGDLSFAEGKNTQAIGDRAHAEGTNTIANSRESHAEGWNNITRKGVFDDAVAAHAEGINNIAEGRASHVEGKHNIAIGENSHVEGKDLVAVNAHSHAEGLGLIEPIDITVVSVDDGNTIIITKTNNLENKLYQIGDYYHVFYNKVDNGDGTFTYDLKGNWRNEPITTETIIHAYRVTGSYGPHSHTEGFGTLATTMGAHAEGGYYYGKTDWHCGGTALGDSSHAEGIKTIALGHHSHTEGELTTALETNSHAEGNNTTTSGINSHAEGEYSKAIGIAAHAEGHGTIAEGNYSHSEGLTFTSAAGEGSHAEGYNTTSAGLVSHTEGKNTIAYNTGSHAEGYYTIAYNEGEHAEGKYNISIQGFSQSTIGVGSTNLERNAVLVGVDGRVFIAGVNEYTGNEKTFNDVENKDVLQAINNKTYSIIKKQTTDEFVTLNPNVYNVWENNIENPLTIELSDFNTYKEYCLDFKIGVIVPTIQWPIELDWSKKGVLIPQPNHHYLVSIINKLVLWEEF